MGVTLYNENWRIAGIDNIWVGESFGKIVNLFERVGLQTNGDKTKAMVFTLYFLLGTKEGGS